MICGQPPFCDEAKLGKAGVVRARLEFQRSPFAPAPLRATLVRLAGPSHPEDPMGIYQKILAGKASRDPKPDGWMGGKGGECIQVPRNIEDAGDF